ncbi:hypothetical protein OL548_26880 [Lysinibacillus sp. MHQ-1]|nr:hypothetical protein OL548_26880 [Lysinibacillus sp. MHQ-1]
MDADQEISSAELAVKAILEKFMEKPAMSRRAINKYLRHAQNILQAQSLRVRLKASIVIVVSDYSKNDCWSSGEFATVSLPKQYINL